MRSVLQHVAALAKRAQIGHPIIGRIAIEVCRCEHDARRPEPCCLHEIGPSGDPSAAVSPRRRLLIEPASVWQTANKGQMSPTATLAPSSSTFEANVVTELMPVGRVQWSQLGVSAWLCRRGPQSGTLEPSSRGRSRYTQLKRAIGAMVRGRAGGSVSR